VVVVHSNCHRNDGFTLVEVLVALAVLAMLAAGMASLLGHAARRVVRARLETTAVLLADARLEQLRSLAWGFGSSYAPVRATDVSTDLTAAEPTTGGSGLTPSPGGVLDTDTTGFVDYLDSHGRWVAGGSGPPPACRFIRRWSVHLAAGSSDAVVLTVRVLDRRGEIEDVVLATLRARVAS
jgi:prepilin-type N-terminal cleavage/methylation domain-containing protein